MEKYERHLYHVVLFGSKTALVLRSLQFYGKPAR